jgi:hypothetical protein
MIRRLLYKFGRWVNSYADVESNGVIAASKPIANDRINSDGMRFTVYHASGGTILEFNEYDRKADRHNAKLHVIPADDPDVTHRIAQIITMETLRY